MSEYELDETAVRPAGYQALIARFDLETTPNWHRSLDRPFPWTI